MTEKPFFERLKAFLTSDTERLIILVALLVCAFHMLFVTLLLEQVTPSLSLDLVLALCLLALLGLHSSKRFKSTGILILIVLWGYITIGTILFGGIQNPLFEAYVIVMIIAGLLYGIRATAFAILVTSLSASFILILELWGMLPQSLIELNSAYIWLGSVANMLGIAGLVAIALGNIRLAAEKTHTANTNLVRERYILRTLIDTLPDAVYIKDREGRFLAANQRQVQVSGLQQEQDLLGKTDLDLFPVHGQSYFADDEKVLKEGQAVLNKEELVGENVHKAVWHLTSKIPLIDADAKVTGLVGIGRDITAMRQTQEALRVRESQALDLQQKLRDLHDVTIALSQAASIDMLYRMAIELGREKLGFDRLGLLLIDEDSQMISGTFGTDPEGNLRDERHFVRPLSEDSHMMEILQSKKRSHYWLDIELTYEWIPIGRGWLVMALLWDGAKSIGWLATDNFLNHEPFSENTVELLTLYGATLGQLVTRKQAEENLRLSQRQLQSRTESLQALYKITEAVHRARDIESVTRQALEAFRQYMGIHVGSIYLLDNENQFLALIASVNIPDEQRSRWQIIPVEGSLTGYTVKSRVVSISSHLKDDERLVPSIRDDYLDLGVHTIVSIPILSGDEILGAINLGFHEDSSVNDIAKQGTFVSIGNTLGLAMANARFVSEMADAKELSESIIESIPDIFFIFSEEGTLLRWNENLEFVSAYPKEELKHLDVHELFTGTEEYSIQQLIDATLAQGDTSSQVVLNPKDGLPIPYIFTAQRYILNDTRAIIATGISISERNELMERLQYRATQLQAAGQISKSIVAVLSTDELLEYTVNLVCTKFDYYYVGLFLLDTQQKYAVLHAGSGEAGQQMVEIGHRLEVGGQSMIGRSIADSQAYIASNIEYMPVHYANPYLPETRSEMAIPLIHRDVCLGAMTVQSSHEDAFSQEDISIIQFIVDHLASALANAKLYDIILRRQRYLGTLRRISQRASPELELDVFLQAVVTALREEFNYAIVGILFADHEKQTLSIGATAMDKIYDSYFDQGDFHQSFDEGIFGWVVSHRQPYLARNTQADPLYQPVGGVARTGSELAVPIQHYNECMGVLSVSAVEEDKLDDLDLEMMNEFANELAVNIQNLRLYAKTRQNAEELEERVAERTSQLEAVNKELEAFAYSVSHDLRAPLRGIDGFSQALLEDYHDQLDDFGKDFLHRIRSASQRMGQLIDDMLTLSRVTRRELVREEVNLSDLAYIVIGIIRQSNPPRKDVQVDIQENVMAYADPRLLQIVLENLMGNAWKFTGKQEKTHLQFGALNKNGRTTYFIKDNGVGFDMTYADKLFGAFQRLHSSNEFEGTGIGLATVQRIILRHGGEVWAESVQGEGATFYFVLDEFQDKHTSNAQLQKSTD